MADSKAFYNFDESRESIDYYMERYQVLYDLEDYKQDKRQQIIITSLSPELYSKVKELIHSKEVISL